MFGGDFFDLHAARRAHHDHGHGLGPVQGDAQIEFLFDLHHLFDQNLAHQFAFGTGLRGDQGHAQNFFSRLLDLVQRSGHLDAAALASAPGVNLGLDGERRPAQLFGYPASLFRRCGHTASWRGHIKPLHQLLGLVFVYLHCASIPWLS